MINKGFLQNSEINYKLDKHMVISYTVTIIHKIFTVLILSLYIIQQENNTVPSSTKYFLLFFYQKVCTPEKNAVLYFSAFYNLVKLHSLTFMSNYKYLAWFMFPCLVPHKHTKV